MVFLAQAERFFYAESIAEGSYTPRLQHVGFKKSEEVSKWPLVAFLLTALFCLGCSTTCHWFADKNHKLCRVVATLDYWGITTLIVGTNYPFISYRYACGYMIVWRYVFTSLQVVFTIGCMVATVNQTFLRPGPKAILFMAFGAMNLVPTVVLFIIYNPDLALEPGIQPYSWGVLFYLLGLTFFLTRFPERYSKTGRYDKFGSSHQIHHCFVLLGLLVSFIESWAVYEQRLAFVCPEDQPVAA